jgi:hypothetical protein
MATQYATFTKVGSNWAIKVPGKTSVGSRVTTRKSSGETKDVVVTDVISCSNGVTVCSFRDVDSPAPKADNYGAKVARAQRHPRAAVTQNHRPSTPRKGGVQEGKYRSVREDKGDDEVGRVCFLKHQGNRIPVTVVGWQCEYVREDGLSFGMPADDGWFVSSYYRDATSEEAEALTTKDTAQKTAQQAKIDAAKAAEQAAMSTARAPLEGLVSCDMVETPAGNRERVGQYGERPTVTVSRITMEDGTVVYLQESYAFDDYRSCIYATPEVINQLREARLVKSPTLTKEAAEEYLAKYRGCVGTAFYEWLAARS